MITLILLVTFIVYTIGLFLDLFVLDYMLEKQIRRTGCAQHVRYSSMFWPYHWGRWLYLNVVSVVKAGFRESRDRWTEYDY